MRSRSRYYSDRLRAFFICSLISECSTAKFPGFLLFLFRVNGRFALVAPSFGLFFPWNTSSQVTRMMRKRHRVACLSRETRISVCDQLSNYLRKFTHLQVRLHCLAISMQCYTGPRQASPETVDPRLGNTQYLPGRSKMDSSGRSRFASGQISSFTCGAGSVPTLSKPNFSANTKIDLDGPVLSRSHFMSSTFPTNTGQGYHDVLERPPALDVPLDAFGTP